MLRPAAAILLFLLAGPSLLFAQVRRPFDMTQAISAAPLPVPVTRFGPLELVEAWRLSSPNDGFGGVSAMSLTGARQFEMISDAGTVIRFRLGTDGSIGNVAIIPLDRSTERKQASDIESLWRDPGSGRTWAAYEGSNRIVRFAPGLNAVEAEARPRAMRRWSGNGGAEAMTRLPDGRWLVLAERARTRAPGTAGLLFPGDPTDPATQDPVRFRYQAWGLGALTDAATLGDGRVLLLHRNVDPWQWFTSTLAIGDPAAIRAGAAWTARPLAALGSPVLSENFEAMALAPHPRGLSIWLASDDNFSPLQQSLLVHLLLPRAAMPPR
jgi:hypothetical protein